MNSKICSKCGKEKDLSEFSKQKDGRFGVVSICKECSKKYRDNRKEEIKIYNKKYQEIHREEQKEYNTEE